MKNNYKVSLLLFLIIVLGILYFVLFVPKNNLNENSIITREDSIIMLQNNTSIDYIEFNNMFSNSSILKSEWDIILNSFPDSTKQRLMNKELFLLKQLQGPDIFWLAVNIKDGVINESAVNFCVWCKGWNKKSYNDRMIMSDLKLFYSAFLIDAYDYKYEDINFDTIFVYNNETKYIFYLIGKGNIDSINFCSALPLKYNIDNNNFSLLNEISTINSGGITHICVSKDNSTCCEFYFNEEGDIIGCKNCSDDGWCSHTIVTPIPIKETTKRFLNKTLEYVRLN